MKTKSLTAAFSLSSFLIMGVGSMTPTVSNADTVVSRTYVACNQYGECWRVHKRYAYGRNAPVTYYNSDWYDAHQNDPNVHWRPDPDNDRGYYDRDGDWHADPGARALAGGATGAGIGAAIGCIVTLPIGCAPGAVVGAAVGGGTGAVAGAASTPH
ncbi:MAG: hypothetical protein ACREEW_00755 [Caulobacteraceae bacterium]